MANIENWRIEELTGYKPMTTFYTDFSIAERFGTDAIKDTYKKGFEYAKTDYKILTEFVMVLNWKIWRWYEKNNTFCTLYNTLWGRADAYACNHLKGEELRYFYATTD